MKYNHNVHKQHNTVQSSYMNPATFFSCHAERSLSMKIGFILFVILILFCLSANSQNSLNDFILQVKTYNKILLAAKEQVKVEVAEAKTNLYPSNPEVEVGYLIGTPSEIGNRTDFSVMQSFDFPTAYIAKRKSSEIRQSQVDLRYKIIENEVITRAKLLWYERIYLTQKHQILTIRLQNAEQIFKHYERMFSSGECNQLQLNQARLQWIASQSEFTQLLSDIGNNQTELNEISGGTAPLSLTESTFPASIQLSADSLMQALENSSQQQLRQLQSNMKKQEISVNKSHSLPQLKLGYYRESITKETFNGIKAGISIPLWENINQVKRARFEFDFTVAEQQQYLLSKKSELQQKLNTLQSITKQIEELKNTLQLVNDEQLLNKALQAGEISLTEYYYETGFYFQNRLLLLDLQKQQLQLQAEIEGMIN